MGNDSHSVCSGIESTVVVGSTLGTVSEVRSKYNICTIYKITSIVPKSVTFPVLDRCGIFYQYSASLLDKIVKKGVRYKDTPDDTTDPIRLVTCSGVDRQLQALSGLIYYSGLNMLQSVINRSVVM